MNTFSPSEQDLHAYVDGQLDEAMRRQIDAYLASHPDAAREVEQLRLDNQRLRTALENIPAAPVPPRLDPFRIRRELRARSQRRMAIAASLVLTLSLGTLGGWQLRDMSMRKTYLPMADATQAYRLFATSDMAQKVDMKTSEPDQLQGWLNRHFVQAAPMPDFSAYGFKPVGGRLMASDKGAAAMVLYQNDAGQAIVYYVRPPGELFNFGAGNRRDGNLLTQYWRQGRYFYAVVSPSDTPSTLPVQRAVEPNRPQS
ncbi:putative transmembrane transcriptional regulator (anti-sigma factor) [Herbaspirillum sp. CF444]|uniref:anti-sigma factor family protein n=1 Tax=Herbaspirillum sp. CF444 TaxID=1144319 RepID=UPI0002723FEC|nr:anti-sigma factor [Herbaspirillum sp. CF444]EJL90423.1 putative transmembrane transcriptional regulator (anti-sigma factor) [Herbaspirillum sp. CF444]